MYDPVHRGHLVLVCKTHTSAMVSVGLRTNDQDEHREVALGILKRNGWAFDNDTYPYPSVTSAVWIPFVECLIKVIPSFSFMF